MRRCTLSENLAIVPACRSDYQKLRQFHYLGDLPPVHSAIFALKPLPGPLFGRIDTAGVIVYCTPANSVKLRNIALGGMLDGLSAGDRLAIINRNIRCISRVIIEPRFRGLGLAARLVRSTMPLMDVAVIEAMAVMGSVNPFFQKAGMTPYHAPEPAVNLRLRQALSIVGLEQDDLLDAEIVHKRLSRLKPDEASFIEQQILSFLQRFGKRRFQPAGLERTRYLLSKLRPQPVYYIWFKPDKKIQI